MRLMVEKCHGIDRKKNSCRRNQIDNTKFCKIHSYMKDYTKKMMKNLTQCKGCKKFCYTKGFSTCDSCRERGKNNRKKNKEIARCKKEGCKYKKSSENDYCGKHQLEVFHDKCVENGTKPCVNSVRGCREELDKDGKFSRCEECRKKEREKDHKKREKFVQNNKLTKKKNLCTKCGKESKDRSFKNCITCRIAQKLQDDKRKGRKRDWKGELERNPERAKKKKKWQEDNWDKMTSYWTKSRHKKINKEGNNYWAKNAKQHKNWVNDNIEKMRKQWAKDKYSLKKIIYNYKRRAKNDEIPWELDDDSAKDLLKGNCYYCGGMDSHKLNGIDRKKNNLGYTKDNCVSCCKMCNMVKGCLDDHVFIDRCQHILTNLGLLDEEDSMLHWECFPDGNCVSFSRYKYRAEKKKIDFKLTQKDYGKFILGDCYICGKETSDTHTNGIDRIDNNKGYILENKDENVEDNCASCCSECNYMKGVYPYKDFVNKLHKIFKHRQDAFVPIIFKIPKKKKKKVFKIAKKNKYPDGKEEKKEKEKTNGNNKKSPLSIAERRKKWLNKNVTKELK